MTREPRRRTPAWKRLLAPVRYLAIEHARKPTFDWWWPLGLAIVTMVVFWLLPVKPEVLGDKGFLKGIRELIGLFAAFFVVALAAVSTFALESLDKPMVGTTPPSQRPGPLATAVRLLSVRVSRGPFFCAVPGGNRRRDSGAKPQSYITYPYLVVGKSDIGISLYGGILEYVLHNATRYFLFG